MNVTKRVLLDLLCFLIASFFICYLWTFGPHQKGFFCEDDSITYPYKESTISSSLLLSIAYGVPFFVILFTEALQVGSFKTDDRPIFFCCWKVSSFCVRIYKVIGIFCIGASLTLTVTLIGKVMVGRLRPHFIDVCRPNVDCTNPVNKFKYIEEFVCQASDKRLIKEARASFPSGHASLMSYAMVYLTIYLQKGAAWSSRYLVKSGLQFSFIAICWFTALSRVSDYHHHSTDVLVGLVFGITIAYLSTRCMSKLCGDHLSGSSSIQGWLEPNGLWKVDHWFGNK